MRKLAALVILAFLTLVPLNGATPLASVQPLSWDGNNHCTTFSINEARGYWSTAFHCVGISDAMMIAGESATVYMTNPDNDTAVLVSAAHAPRMRLASDAPKPGDKLTMSGFPLGIEGLQGPIVMQGVFLNTFKDDDGIHNMYDITAAHGNSGSPVYSKHGVIGTLNFGWQEAGRLGGGTVWAALNQLVERGVWER